MNKTDKVYIDLLNDIMENGVEKTTRAGDVYSVFGRQLRFDLKDGFPLLTTKKVFTKGIIHELLWFLQRPYNSHGSMNIEYLIRNGVHIWDDDAYRWFKTEIAEGFSKRPLTNEFMVCVTDDEGKSAHKKPAYEYWIENESRHRDIEWLKNITKEEFIDLTLQRVEIHGSFMSVYRFGDLGPIYGKQWRSFGHDGVDQIQDIINMDIFGGVDVDLNSEEIAYLHRYRVPPRSVVSVTSGKDVHYTTPPAGTYHLNGHSAVLYMRIRKAGGGGDFMRTQRVRTVLSKLADKCRSISWEDAQAFANSILDHNNKTNMNLQDMMNAAEQAFQLRSCTIEELRIPAKDAVRPINYANMAAQEIHWPSCREAMADYLQNSFLVIDDEDE